MPQRVVIVGAGFGGVFAAKHLSRLLRGKAEVEIVDDNNYFVFQPLLPEVAAGTVDPADAVTPLRFLLPGVRASEAQVAAIDFENRQVEVVQGWRRRQRRIAYDHLVIALGQVTDLSRYPGLPEHALTMKDLADAFRLRNHVINCLEQADIEEDADFKRRMLTFVVIGGGLSGVETLGEVEEMISRSLRFYPRIRRNEIRLVLVEYMPRILPEVADRLAEYAVRKLQQRGIEMVVGTGVKGASADCVQLADGREIRSMTVIATIGNGPTPLVRSLPLPKLKGRIVTDRFLRVEGRDGVWALGDVAAVPCDDGDPPPLAPPTAQAAVQEAEVLARNVAATIDGGALAPFTFHKRGQLASLGGRRGVAEIMGRQISGLPAWVLWRWVYLALLPGWGAKVRVALDWFLDTLFPRNIVQIAGAPARSVRRARFRAGDMVFERGEVTGPFYLVLSGSFERVDAGRGPPQVIGPGGHFGEGSLMNERLRRTSVRAREESYCLVVEREDFETLAECLGGLRDFLEDRLQRNREAASR